MARRLPRAARDDLAVRRFGTVPGAGGYHSASRLPADRGHPDGSAHHQGRPARRELRVAAGLLQGHEAHLPELAQLQHQQAVEDLLDDAATEHAVRSAHQTDHLQLEVGPEAWQGERGQTGGRPGRWIIGRSRIQWRSTKESWPRRPQQSKWWRSWTQQSTVKPAEPQQRQRKREFEEPESY